VPAPSKEIQERVQQLALEMHVLLEKNVLLDPQLAEKGMERAAQIRQEIESYGFLVTWELGMTIEDDQTPVAKVNVTIWQVKENLSLEERALYDQWFTRSSGIRNDQEKPDTET